LKEVSLMKDQEILITEDIQNGLKLDSVVGKLVALKKEFPDKRDAVLLLDSEILYETIIDIMDAVRINGDTELFPDISLADRILEER